jgi:hypothetical protein
MSRSLFGTDIVTKALWAFLAIAVFVFVSMLLLTGLHP